MEYLSVDEKTKLEKLKLKHTEIIYNAINSNRDFLGKWLPFVPLTQKVEDTTGFICSIQASSRDEVFVVWHKNQFAGLIGYKEIDTVNQKAEIGYWLCENMQGKGIMTSCVHELVAHGFNEKKLNRIQIKTAEGNIKSANIPKRISFQFEGIERQGERHGAHFLNLEIYSLLKGDFVATK